jgi:hypothetical protein
MKYITESMDLYKNQLVETAPTEVLTHTKGVTEDWGHKVLGGSPKLLSELHSTDAVGVSPHFALVRSPEVNKQ